MKAVTTEQMRELDARTIAAGTPGVELMERAGFAVAKAAIEFLKKSNERSVLVFAGKGSNGGDAFVAARHLAAAGCTPTLVLVCRRNELTGDAQFHFSQLTGGVRVVDFDDVVDAVVGQAARLPASPSTNVAGAPALHELVAETPPAVIIDGLLGTGLTGEVRDPVASAIRYINELHVPVVAIDVPSGLGTANSVRADVTVTMGLPKIELLKHPDEVGRIEVADIGLVSEVDGDVELITSADVRLPERKRSAHKGDFGHLLVVAGSEGYTGAAVLCAHAAARSGVGLVTLAVPESIYPIIATKCPPTVMPRPLEKLDSLGRFSAVVIGPGIGSAPAMRTFMANFIVASKVPVVADADALGVLDLSSTVWGRQLPPLVLTPHPGEMARLVGKTTAEVQANRWEVAREFTQHHDVVLALKGAGTVVTDQSQKLWLNMTGNPGMAKGGMGDVLAGMIGALVAQGLPPLEATKTGVFVHGRAGDLAAERHGMIAMLPTDVIELLGAAFQL